MKVFQVGHNLLVAPIGIEIAFAGVAASDEIVYIYARNHMVPVADPKILAHLLAIAVSASIACEKSLFEPESSCHIGVELTYTEQFRRL